MWEDIVLSERVFTATDNADSSGTSSKAVPSACVQSDKPNALLSLILSSLEDDKAEDVVCIDLVGKSEMADHMVIASGRSSRQVSSLAEKLVDRLKSEMGRLCRMEGKASGDWVLIDCGDAVVHIFRPEVREFYQLEKMWLSPSTEATQK